MLQSLVSLFLDSRRMVRKAGMSPTSDYTVVHLFLTVIQVS